MLPVNKFSPFFAGCIQSCKEEVLQNGFIVCASGFIHETDQFINLTFIKKIIRNKLLFFHEPNKNDSRNQSYHSIHMKPMLIFSRIIWKANLAKRIKVPLT